MISWIVNFRQNQVIGKADTSNSLQAQAETPKCPRNWVHCVSGLLKHEIINAIKHAVRKRHSSCVNVDSNSQFTCSLLLHVHDHIVLSLVKKNMSQNFLTAPRTPCEHVKVCQLPEVTHMCDLLLSVSSLKCLFALI